MPRNTKRKDGRYQAKVYVGFENNKSKYKYVYASFQRELDKKVTELRTKLGKGIDPFAERDTFGQWAEAWLALKKVEVSAGRYASYSARRKNLAPLDNMPIAKLRAADFQDIILECASTPNERTGKPYSHYTLEEIKNVAAQVMALAIDNRVLDYNCVSAVKLPKNTEEHEKRRALTDEEQKWIRETPHRAQTAAMIMMYAGLRRGELIALLWSDIDLKAGTINIDKSVEIINNASRVKDGGKTYYATRTVYIPKILIDYLSNVPDGHFGNVVKTVRGTRMSATAWRRMWDSYLDDLNLKYGDWNNYIKTHDKKKKPSKFAPEEKPMLIPRITAHWLRHTFITMMYFAGVDILTAKEQAGHADIKTTMEIYTHLDAKHKKKNISKLDEYLSEKTDMGVKTGVKIQV